MADAPSTPEGTQPEGGKPEAKPEGQDKTFSQVELDAVVRDRLKREREKYADYDSLKDKASKFEQFEEQNRSETEKAIERARKEARAEAESEFEKSRRADRLQVAVAKYARELADVDDVVLNLERDGTDGLFDKEGRIDQQALDAALKAKLEEKPHLKAQGVGKPQGSANGGEGEGGEGFTFNDLLRRGGG